VTDSAGQYHGVVEIKDIRQARADKSIAALMRADRPAVSAETDQEHAVEAATNAGVAAQGAVYT